MKTKQVELVVNRFKKNVSLHVETTDPQALIDAYKLWIALKKMYLYTLKQLLVRPLPLVQRCESL